MNRFRRICLLSISLLSMLTTVAQPTFPEKEGDKVRYTAYIETPKAYVSGICVLVNAGDEVRGSLFNEFGITAISFSYQTKKDKVKLHEVLPMLDKWYIRRVLRKDLRQLMHGLQRGEGRYTNDKYKLSYQLTPMDEETEEGDHRQ